MAQYGYTREIGIGARSAQIDEGLRAHMNKVYGLMSVAMLITAAVAWGISGLTTTTDPSLAAAEFRNGVYEQSDSLQPVADKLKLSVRTVDNVSRAPAAG